MATQPTKHVELTVTDAAADVRARAFDLGLYVQVYTYGHGAGARWFWMVSTESGRELGTYTPATGHWRALGNRGQSDDWRQVLLAYAHAARERGLLPQSANLPMTVVRTTGRAK